MRISASVVIAYAFAGCGFSPDHQTARSAVQAALTGIVPDDEMKKTWRKVSELEPDRFQMHARTPVVEICLRTEEDFYKCQRNTQIMKDADWKIARTNLDAMARTFCEGLRIFMGNPVSPIADDVQSIREQLRKAQEAKQKVDAGLKDRELEVEELMIIVNKDETTLKAIKGDPGAADVLKGYKKKIAKSLIKRDLKIKKHFDQFKLQAAYAPFFSTLTYEEMNDRSKLETLADNIYNKLIN
jgi:hypothetical protein